MKKRMLSTLLVLCMALTLIPITAHAEETYGTCGDNVTWSFSNGTLTIQGIGDMEDYSSVSKKPWRSYRERIYSVIIGEGVTSIGSYAFEFCTNLTNVSISSSVTVIGSAAFADCGLVSVDIPDGVLFIGTRAFGGCYSLTDVTIPNSVVSIGTVAFGACGSLTNVTIPNSVTSIGKDVFSGCIKLTDVYYTGSEADWRSISISNENSDLFKATIHYNSTGPGQGDSAPSEEANIPNSSGGNSTDEHIYDTTDSGEDTKMDADRLNRVTDPTSAAEAVRNMVNGMTQAQKDSSTGIDLATLYAETAVAKAASKPFTGNDVLINAAAVTDLDSEAAQALTAVETALVNGGIATARYPSSTVTLTTTSTSEISIRIDPDILATGVDKVRVEGPSYALTFNISELEEDLTNILTFQAEPVNASGIVMASGNAEVPFAVTLLVNRTAGMEPVYLANTGTNAVKVTLPGGSTSNPVTVSLPKDNSKDTTYQAMVNSTGTATSSKYNPATTSVDGKVNTSGTYMVTTKEVNFTDIANKSVEMQKAIKYLASKGIISGTGGTNYSPDASISRAEIAALLVRALGKLNSSTTNSFTDVKISDWYYSAAGSSQKAGYISGYEDNTFRGTTTINKEQILAVAARVLISDMKYKTPSNTATYLSKYSDMVASWAQPQVALATKENLVVYRTDGTFSGAKNMTRGDAAIIIYRLFQKIW